MIQLFRIILLLSLIVSVTARRSPKFAQSLERRHGYADAFGITSLDYSKPDMADESIRTVVEARRNKKEEKNTKGKRDKKPKIEEAPKNGRRLFGIRRP